MINNNIYKDDNYAFWSTRPSFSNRQNFIIPINDVIKFFFEGHFVIEFEVFSFERVFQPQLNFFLAAFLSNQDNNVVQANCNNSAGNINFWTPISVTSGAGGRNILNNTAFSFLSVQKVLFSIERGGVKKNIVNNSKTTVTGGAGDININTYPLSAFSVGSQGDGNNAAIRGWIRNFRLFKGVFVENSEESILYNGGNHLPTDSLPLKFKDALVGDYRCNQRNGNIVIDYSLYQNHGIIQNYSLIDKSPNGNAWRSTI
jgi:hypothetical protein